MLRRLINFADSSTGFDARSSIAQIYRPVIRGYFGVAAIYYIVMTLTHFWEFGGSDLLHMAAASITASLFALFSWHALRKPLSTGKLEALTSVTNMLILVNVLVALHLEYAQPKLIYFMMMAMIFAFACVSMRQALFSIIAALGGLIYELFLHESGQMGIYGFISFAAALSAIAITFFLRRAIGLAVAAKHEAELGREEAQNLGETMRQRSLSDSLTGLPNRRAFFETYTKYKNGGYPSHAAWLILLDLDGFKTVNDVYGHIMGDELLKNVAERLRKYCGTNAHVSRMGGDEFNIILTTNAGVAAVEVWCQKLLPQIAEIYRIDDRLIQVSGSIGCTEIIVDEADTQLIRNADYALLHAKRTGKNRVVVFCDEHAKNAAESRRIEQALRVADFDSEIELVFQPQFDLGQNKVVRAEVLARWDSPTLGPIGPDRFIKVAEESGLIANITLTVLHKAITALKSWDQPFPLSVNLSGHDLIADQVIDQIISTVQDSDLDPALLEFEVTESAMMSDTQKASANLGRLAALGHPIALDDFGTGYSNFGYLRTLPISKLKVDRSFMENLTDPMTEKILHSLAGMARTLDVQCLLEGVENELELLMAKRVGAQSVQGYYFGIPMSAVQLFEYLDEQSALSEQPIRSVAS
ncbi:putative bifunctional diguanylate cyclase/phosphodiesterase [Parasphingorhabdus sp.]|uniref:putative bifunctional diguanylate cyclase/phosphodiesterase n=1 Tax=Parasphingorhabdus sp. TaxID=2709688 RepID=UPI003003A562